jgi:hypothetical protein
MSDLSVIILLSKRENYVKTSLNKIRPQSPKEKIKWIPMVHQFLRLPIVPLV